MFLKMRAKLITPTAKAFGAIMRAHVHNGEIHTAAAYMDKIEDEYPELMFYDHNSLEGELEDPAVLKA